MADEPSEFNNLRLFWEKSSGVPSWIQGSYVKNGPSQRRFGDENRWYNNYMDSWGKLTKITFTGDGSVEYSGRMIETDNYLKCKEANRLVPTVTVGEVKPNDWSIAEDLELMSSLFDNTNVILWRLGAEDPTNATYIATTDYPLVHYINPFTMDVTGKHAFGLLGGHIDEGITMMTASHWRREVGSDNSLNFHFKYNPVTMKPDFVLYRFGRSIDEAEEVGRFEADYASYIHMMSNTPRYAVVVLYPVFMNLMKMPLYNMHPLQTLEMKDGPTLIKLIDLLDGSVLSFETDEPSMVFATHIANAWEEGEDEVVFDIATNPWDALISYMNLETMMNHPTTDAEVADMVMKRVKLVKSSSKVIVEDLANDGGDAIMNTFDFPTINENYSGYKNRYIYGWVSIDYWRMTLVKRDLEDPAGNAKWFKPSHYPGEMWFLPNPEGVEEDDGVLITLVFDGEREQSYVMILDAKTFEEIDIAYLPYNVPFSFHGNWFPEIF